MTQHGQVGVPGSTAALAATSLEFETARNARRAAAKAGARLSSRAQHGLKVIQAENGFRTDGAKSGQIAQTSKEGARRARTLGHAGAGFTCRVDVLAPSEASPLQPLSGLLSVDRGGSAGRLLAHELEKHQTPEQKEFEPTAREIFAAHQASAFWGERLDRPVSLWQDADGPTFAGRRHDAYDVTKYCGHVEYGTVEEWNRRDLINRLVEKRRLHMGGMYTAKALELAVQKFARVGRA